jgi:type I pantothenate kinase
LQRGTSIGTSDDLAYSPYRVFEREEWARLRADTPMTLTQPELERLSGVIERISIADVEEIYLPLSRLLNLYVAASQELHTASTRFLHQEGRQTPFIIGIAGSVAVGKSTTARVLRELLARWPDHPRVDLVTTDGFLYPNAVLEERNLMSRKGFPESFDTKRLLQFLADVKAGRSRVTAPVYSHFHYDVVPDQTITVDRPDILIVEGLNVLQPARLPKDGKAIPYVSDFFDFSIYIDADDETIESWYISRFLRLRETAFRDPGAYFHRYASLSDEAARQRAIEIWRSINAVNLRRNILPRGHARNCCCGKPRRIRLRRSSCANSKSVLIRAKKSRQKRRQLFALGSMAEKSPRGAVISRASGRELICQLRVWPHVGHVCACTRGFQVFAASRIPAWNSNVFWIAKNWLAETVAANIANGSRASGSRGSGGSGCVSTCTFSRPRTGCSFVSASVGCAGPRLIGSDCTFSGAVIEAAGCAA